MCNRKYGLIVKAQCIELSLNSGIVLSTYKLCEGQLAVLKVYSWTIEWQEGIKRINFAKMIVSFECELFERYLFARFSFVVLSPHKNVTHTKYRHTLLPKFIFLTVHKLLSWRIREDTIFFGSSTQQTMVYIQIFALFWCDFLILLQR